MAGDSQKARLESHPIDQSGDSVILDDLAILLHRELDTIENCSVGVTCSSHSDKCMLRVGHKSEKKLSPKLRVWHSRNA